MRHKANRPISHITLVGIVEKSGLKNVQREMDTFREMFFTNETNHIYEHFESDVALNTLQEQVLLSRSMDVFGLHGNESLRVFT